MKMQMFRRRQQKAMVVAVGLGRGGGSSVVELGVLCPFSTSVSGCSVGTVLARFMEPAVFLVPTLLWFQREGSLQLSKKHRPLSKVAHFYWKIIVQICYDSIYVQKTMKRQTSWLFLAALSLV